MKQSMISAGIDIGTSTTQLMFCRLIIENRAGYGMVPQVEIVSREVLYRSRVWMTPLKYEDEIDEQAVRSLIVMEYEHAGIRPEEVEAGAVIITGESMRRRNARELTMALAEYAGNFVVAEAGPDLESVLAGLGAGADKLSRDSGKVTANLDIGGGTTNISVFEHGELIDTACYEIGGRQIRIEDQRVTYLSKRLEPLVHDLGLSIRVGDVLQKEEAETLCRRMAELLAEALGYREKSGLEKQMVTMHGLGDRVPEQITCSGGVADCLRLDSWFAYGDIGDVLGRAIWAQPELAQYMVKAAGETMRATVAGAGNFSMELSGSTIEYAGFSFPVKNRMVLHIQCSTSEDIEHIGERINKKMGWLELTNQSGLAVSMDGLACPSFTEIERMAEQIVRAVPEDGSLILIVYHDIAKALGKAIRRKRKENDPLICLDGLKCGDGDYLDIGNPVAGGTVLPVVVKTLIYGTEKETRRKHYDSEDTDGGRNL